MIIAQPVFISLSFFAIFAPNSSGAGAQLD
jgi:hypothetical protein